MTDTEKAALIEKVYDLYDERLKEIDAADITHELCKEALGRALEAVGFFDRPAQDGWQPIETAPRDGTWIVIVNHRGNYEACRYEPYYSYSFEEVGDGLYWRKMRHEPGDILNWQGSSNFHRATHWRPLPAPPVTETEGK